jgi:hypothetical protein
MGIFDKKDSPIFGDKPRSDAAGKTGAQPDFSDTTSSAGSTSPSRPTADFSDVTSGSSTSAPATSGGQRHDLLQFQSMTTEVQRVLSAALALPPDARVEIADRLMASVGPDEPVSAEWAAEIRARLAGIKDGTAELYDHDDVVRTLEEDLRAVRSERGPS